MIKIATVFILPVAFGATIALKGQFMTLVLALFVVLFFLDIVDIFTKVRLERMRKNYQSKKMKAGLDQRLHSYTALFFFSILVYFVIGSVCGRDVICGMICRLLSLVPLSLTSLYIINTLASIIENNIARAYVMGIKPQEATIVFAKFLGIAFTRIKNKILKNGKDE